MDIQLSFEQPIYELEAQLAEMERNAGNSPAISDSIQKMRREVVELKQRIYQNLQPWETVEVSRHPNRPQTRDYLNFAFDEFVELHGDRFYGDDRAILTGWAKLDGISVMLVGHQKGKTLLLRLRPSGRLPQGDAENALGSQIPPAGHLPD